MEKTHVYKADSDEKLPCFSEKSRGNFSWFPYGTSDEKVSHNFPEKFRGNFPVGTFPEMSGISEKFPDKICWKSFSQIFEKNLYQLTMTIIGKVYCKSFYKNGVHLKKKLYTMYITSG